MGSPVWSHEGIFVVGNAHKDKVNPTFSQGARLADTKKLFNAGLGGNRWRAIDLSRVDRFRRYDNFITMKIKDAVTALSALAQESRLEVFRLLVEAGNEGVPAGEIAEELDIPPATLSFHLKELRNASLIDSERDGRSIIYRVQIGGIRGLVSFITEDCCQGRPELCMPSRKTAKRVSA